MKKEDFVKLVEKYDEDTGEFAPELYFVSSPGLLMDMKEEDDGGGWLRLFVEALRGENKEIDYGLVVGVCSSTMWWEDYDKAWFDTKDGISSAVGFDCVFEDKEEAEMAAARAGYEFFRKGMEFFKKKMVGKE
jgi:hypothetical protein